MTADTPMKQTPTLQEATSDAIRYWEPRRIVYNLILAVVFIACIAMHWSRFVQVFGLDRVPALFIIAVLVNVFYCLAYALDLFVQLSAFREKRRLIRHAVWLIGTLFAASLTFYWTMGGLLGDAKG